MAGNKTKSIMQILRERDPMKNVKSDIFGMGGAFNEKELRKNATRSALNRVNRDIDIAAKMRATRERLAREAGQTRNVD